MRLPAGQAPSYRIRAAGPAAGYAGEEKMEFEKLRQIVAGVLNMEAGEISMDTRFADDLGADSLDVFQIIMGIEDAFDIEIDNDEAEKIVTVGDAVEPIKNATN